MANRIPNLVNVDLDNIILSTFILFVQTADTVLKFADAHLYRKARLSVIKHMVLQILAANGGTMTPSEIAKWTLRERHGITTLVERLKRDGLVKTERNSSDKRVVNVTLTAKGRKVLQQTTLAAKEIVNRVMLSINDGDAILLKNSLMVLRQNAHDALEHL